MKILLFGDQGQVGKEVLAATNVQIEGFDLDSIDITNKKQLLELFSRHQDANVVINAAAYTAVDKAEDEVELAYAVNRNGVENLALACKKYSIPLIHLSTDYVFSGKNDKPYTEEDKTGPLCVYGKSKLAGEEVLQKILPQHIIVRISWVFGKYGNNFVKTILRLAKERATLNVVADQYGCPTPAADIARVLLDIAQQVGKGKKNWGVYHYCGKKVTTWYDFATKIVEFAREKEDLALKSLAKITTAEYPTKAVRPQNSELKVQKITEYFEIKQHAWLDYLKTVIEELQL